MLRPLAQLTCSLALLCAGLVAHGATATKNVEQEVARLEKDSNDAYAANNLPKYFSYYADDAVLIFINERTTTADYRKLWTEEVKTKPLESVKLSDMVVRVIAADAAIASYQIEVRTHQPGGGVTDERFFETDVWVHKADGWKLGHVHYSAIPPK
jgi:ketosteroid isomerase-like protein